MPNSPIVLANDASNGVFTRARTRRASKKRFGLEDSSILTCDKSISGEILPSSLGEEHIRFIEKKNAAPSIGKREIRL